jgi:hypothetical protein
MHLIFDAAGRVLGYVHHEPTAFDPVVDRFITLTGVARHHPSAHPADGWELRINPDSGCANPDVHRTGAVA